MTKPSTENENAEQVVEIRHQEGLHMRPAMQLVDCANRFESRITVQKDNQIVDAKSIMQVTMLAATQGTILKLSAQGRDAQAAVAALAKLLKDGIGQQEQKQQKRTPQE